MFRLDDDLPGSRRKRGDLEQRIQAAHPRCDEDAGGPRSGDEVQLRTRLVSDG